MTETITRVPLMQTRAWQPLGSTLMRSCQLISPSSSRAGEDFRARQLLQIQGADVGPYQIRFTL